MQGQTLPEDIYFLGRCDEKGFTGKGGGEIQIKFHSEDLPERSGDLYLASGGSITRPGGGIFDLMMLKLVEPLPGEPWPRWDEIFEPFANPGVEIEELGRVELVREAATCSENGTTVKRGYTFTVAAVVGTKNADDFDHLMRDDHDDSAVRCRRMLALALAGQHKVMLGLRSLQLEMDLDGDQQEGTEAPADERQGDLGV